MPLTTSQKTAQILRWFGYQSDTDDIATVTARVTSAIADSDALAVIDTMFDRLQAMDERIYTQSLRVPHGNLYLLNFVEMVKELKRLSNVLGLPIKSNAEQVWNETTTASAISAMLSPAVTPIISLPAFNYEDCILRVAPITSDTKPKNVAKGQLWNTITNPQTFEFDGWLWRGRTQGINCGNFNIEFESTITHASAGLIATRIAGDTFATGSGVSATPLGLAIDYVRSAIAYDNVIDNNLKTSGVTGMVAVGVINTGGTAGRWGKRLLANNNDSFQKPIAQSPPTGVNTQAVETWNNQSPPDFSTPDAIDNRRVNNIDPNTAVPGAYLINGAQGLGTVNLAVDTGTGAPQAGTQFTIGADQTIYTIGVGATTTSWSISPSLVVAAADNAVIRLLPDSQIYQVGAGATTTSWLINPPLQRAVADNAVITIRGASLERDSNLETVVAAGFTTVSGGKTRVLNRNTHVQGNLATADYTYVSPATESVYEYFEPITGYTKIGLCIRTVADSGQSLRVTGTVAGAYSLTLPAN